MLVKKENKDISPETNFFSLYFTAKQKFSDIGLETCIVMSPQSSLIENDVYTW